MTRLGLILSCLFWLVGCSTPQISVLVQRDGAQALLRDGEGLFPGDRFALQINVPQDSYVYVARSIQDSGTQNLFPLDGPRLVPAGGSQRVPANGEQITLEPFQPGDRLCVVLSTKPLIGSLPRCPSESEYRRLNRDSDTQGAHLGKGQRPGDDSTTSYPLPVAPCPAPASGPGPGRRALLIGIDHYLPAQSGLARASDLHGATNDVQAIRSVLRARYGFTDREICVLQDGQATRAGILQALRSFLIAPTQSGDQTFFYYAGHGSTAPNERSIEVDRQDETIVPADANRGVPDLRDKELARLFNQILDRGGKLVGVFDSCHSGSVTMSAQNPVLDGVSLDSERRVRYAAPAAVQYPALSAVNPPPQARGALILTATQSFQSAQEMPIGGVQRGLFTAALVRALLSNPLDQPVESLVQSVGGFMREWSQTDIQIPGIETDTERRRQPFFGGKTGDGVYVAVARNTDRGVLLQAGHGLGLGPGAELERTTGPALRLRVSETLDIATSLATVIAGDEATLRSGDLLRLRSYGRPARATLRLWLGEPGPEPGALAEASAALAPLLRHPTIHLMKDLQAEKPSHILRFQGGAWKLWNTRDSQFRVLGSRLTAAYIQAALPADARLFVHWRLDAVQRRELHDALSRVGAISLTQDASTADYILLGSLQDHPQYAFAQLRPPTEPGPMPTALPWGEYKDLPQQAVTLHRQRTWLELSNPPDAESGFPYRMQIVNASTGQPLGPNARTKDGEFYYLRLEVSPSTKPQPVEPRYVYLCVTSNRGQMGLLYPSLGGNQENYLPPNPHWIPRIDLPNVARFQTRGPTSIDTYLLLSSTQPLDNPTQSCSSSQYMATCPPDGTPGAELCYLLQGVNHPPNRTQAPTPARWSVQRLQVHHGQ